MRICIVTGGTGGHIYPALALADSFRRLYPKCKILFIGNDDRMEASVVPAAGYDFRSLHTSGLVGSIINKGRATSSDIIKLIREVSERVYRNSGVRLEPEVRMIGFD